MSTQIVIAVIGILATALFGLWAIALAVRYNRRVRVTFAHEDTIALTDDITQNFPDLKMSYRGKPVSDNLVLLKGYFLNTGRRDISREMVEERVSMTLPSDFEWVDCRVVKTSPSLKATAQIVDKITVSFNTGLWKSREYMKFEALAKVPVVKSVPGNPVPERPTVRLTRAISMSHRIADSKTIYETRLPRRPSKLSSKRGIALLQQLLLSNKLDLPMAIAMIFVGLVFSAAARLQSNSVLGISATIDGTHRELMQTVKDSTIILKDDQGFEKKYSLPEFEAIAGKVPCIIQATNKEFLFVGYIYISLGLLALALFGYRRFRAARMLALIASKTEPDT